MDRTATISEIYVFVEPAWASLDLSGYHVEGVDGEIGTVDETTYEIGADALVVNTGPWIFGKKVMLPVGVINRVDESEQKVFVTLTKDQDQKFRSSTSPGSTTASIATRWARTTG